MGGGNDPLAAARRLFDYRPTRPPAFSGKQRRTDASYAREWVKKRLRTLHRELRAAGKPTLPEPAAHLYLLLATYVLDRRFHTERIALRELVEIMHVEPVTVRRAREVLEDRLGEVRLVEGGQGSKWVVFAFVQMGGPLLEAGLAEASTSNSQIEVAEDLDLTDRGDFDRRDRRTPKHRSHRSKRTGDPLLSTRSVEEDPPTTADHQGGFDGDVAQAHAFLAEFVDAFAVVHDGSHYTIHSGDIEIVQALLEPRTSKRLLACANYMWQVRPAHRDQACKCDFCFVGRASDKGIRLLRKKINFLDQEVSRLGLHAPPEAAVWADLLERVRHRVSRWRVDEWLAPCRLMSDDGETLTIATQSVGHRKVLASMGLERALMAVVAEVLPGRRLLFWFPPSTAEALG